VANNFLGFSKSSEIIFPLVGSSSKESSMSFGEREKRATSAPETNAEQMSNVNIAIKPNTKSASSADEKNKLGSESKL